MLPTSLVPGIAHGVESGSWCESICEWSIEGCKNTVPKPLIPTLPVYAACPNVRQVMFNYIWPEAAAISGGINHYPFYIRIG